VELETDLRVASDRILRTLEQIEVLENEKRDLPPSDARFQTLAKEIERLASEVFAQSHAQKQMGVRAEAVEDRTGVELPSINETNATRELAVVLAEWRDAERRLQLAAPDSAEHVTAAADVGRLREEYHRAYTSGAAKQERD
jgi:hypothetical protein